MTRLTKGRKRTLLEALTKRRFEPLYLALITEGRAIAEEFYKAAFSQQERLQMEALPDGWLPTDDSLDFNVGGQRRRIDWDGAIGGAYQWKPTSADIPTAFDMPENVNKLLPWKYYRCYAGIPIPADSALAVRLSELDQKLTTLNEEYMTSWIKLRAALDCVSTVKQLLAGWPEVEPFVPIEWRGVKTNLPAIPVMKLNEMLDLPAEELQ